MKTVKALNFLIVFLFICLIFLAYENTQKTDFVEENYIKPLEIGIPQKTSERENPQLTLKLSSDREIYHSSEEMELRTNIETETKIENLTVKVYGIRDRRGNFRVSGERILNIEPPGTSETFEFRMPSCYGCAGVSPGDYEIIFEAIHNGEILGNFSKTVKLEK
jgi:hypothetical protein